jgi:FkbM family methyltransferase
MFGQFRVDGLRLWVRTLLRGLGYDLHSLPAESLTLRDLEFDLPYLIKAVRPSILDVGANTGQSIDLFRRTLVEPKIYSFEPNPELAEQLRERYANNGVTVEAVAAGSKSGSSRFTILENNQLSSVLDLHKNEKNPFSATGVERVIDTPITTLDDYVRSAGLEHVHLLKIDTQGFDLEVLRGAADILGKSKVDTILIEVNFISIYRGQSTFGEIERLLAEKGYGLLTFYEINRFNSCIRWATACFRRG